MVPVYIDPELVQCRDAAVAEERGVGREGYPRPCRVDTK
jgi:hypothetical protein